VLAVGGAATPCAVPGAVLVVSSTDCSFPTLLALWTLDPALDSLDLAISSPGSACWVAPGEVARASGATAADVALAASGQVPTVLRSCGSGGGRVAVACSARHELEWVGEWSAALVGLKAPQVCAAAGARYTGMTLDGPDRLIAVVAERRTTRPEFRCAVKVESVSLNGSLRNLAGRPIPRA
jgi:hypothetical protein